MNTFVEIVSPGFLLRDALIGSVLVGVVCPLIGVYFVLRRMIFLGVALPQLSGAGIAFAFLVYRTVIGPHVDLQAGEQMLARIGASVFTLSGILILAAFERRGRQTLEARIGVTYAAAGALTILCLAVDPHGEAQMVNLLKGDLLATTRETLGVLAVVFGIVVLCLIAFQKEFLLVSFDRDLAVVFGKRVGVWDTVLYVLCGITIAFGVSFAGPLVTFGFLLAPPLTARLLARRMVSFSIVSAVVGGLTAFAGFYCAFRFDLPLGPAEVAMATLVLLIVGSIVWLRQVLGGRRA